MQVRRRSRGAAGDQPQRARPGGGCPTTDAQSVMTVVTELLPGPASGRGAGGRLLLAVGGWPGVSPAAGSVLVVVPVVPGMPVPVVGIVGVAVVGDGDVAAALAVGVVMAGVLGVRWCAHGMFSSWLVGCSLVCRMASVTMWATCSSVSE